MGIVLMRKHPVYIAGIITIFIATILFIIGSVAPAWVRKDAERAGLGLWFLCYDNATCLTYNIGRGTDWAKVTQILEVIAMLFLVFACCTAIFVECGTQPRPHSYFLESVLLIGGLVGLSGPMVYLGYTRQAGLLPHFYGWAFCLNVAAAALAIVTSVVLLITSCLTSSSSSPAHDSYLPWDDAGLSRKPYPESIPAGGLFPLPEYAAQMERPSLPDYQTSGLYPASPGTKTAGTQHRAYTLQVPDCRTDPRRSPVSRDGWDDASHARHSPRDFAPGGRNQLSDDFITWDTPPETRRYIEDVGPYSPSGDYSDVMGSPYNVYVPVYTIPRAVLRTGYPGYPGESYVRPEVEPTWWTA